MAKADLCPCPGCARHVRVSETVCPFCQVRLSDGFGAQRAPRPPAIRLGRAALSALGAGSIVLASSCSGSNVQPPYGGPPPVDARSDVSPSVDAADGGPPGDARAEMSSSVDAAYGGPPVDGPKADGG